MTNWQNENISGILEYPFDFERYILEQIREIEDLDERRYAKKVLMEGLWKSIQAMESKYQSLEERVRREMEIPEERYNIFSTIVNKVFFDPTNNFLFPICVQDLSVDELKESFAQKSKNFVETVYLEADLKSCNHFVDHKFKGVVSFGDEKKEMMFYVEKSHRYRYAVEQLYKAFHDNSVPWRTLNTAYIDHFYDIFIYDEYEIEDILEYTIDFKHYASKVLKNFIPVWNIDHIYFSSANFRLPCMNDIHYEHELIFEDQSAEDGYLIEFNEDILGVRHEITDEKNQKVIIKSKKEKYKNWLALSIRHFEANLPIDYTSPLIGNKKKDTFLRRYAEHTQVCLATKVDFIRKIAELDIDYFVEIVDCELRVESSEFPMTENMNWFMEYSIFPMEDRKILLFSFREKAEKNYLNDSMIKYAVSHMQMQLNEYRCVGQII